MEPKVVLSRLLLMDTYALAIVKQNWVSSIGYFCDFPGEMINLSYPEYTDSAKPGEQRSEQPGWCAEAVTIVACQYKSFYNTFYQIIMSWLQ